MYKISASKPYVHVRTKLAIATIINTTKVITTNNKAHYKGNLVKCTIVDEIIKNLKKKRCKPNAVIARLYTSCLLYTSPSPRDS